MKTPIQSFQIKASVYQCTEHPSCPNHLDLLLSELQLVISPSPLICVHSPNIPTFIPQNAAKKRRSRRSARKAFVLPGFQRDLHQADSLIVFTGLDLSRPLCSSRCSCQLRVFVKEKCHHNPCSALSSGWFRAAASLVGRASPYTDAWRHKVTFLFPLKV